MSDFEDVTVKVSRFFDQLGFGELADVACKQDIDRVGTGYVKLGYKALFIAASGARGRIQDIEKDCIRKHYPVTCKAER